MDEVTISYTCKGVRVDLGTTPFEANIIFTEDKLHIQKCPNCKVTHIFDYPIHDRIELGREIRIAEQLWKENKLTRQLLDDVVAQLLKRWKKN